MISSIKKGKRYVLLLGCCVGRFVVEKNSLKVTSPKSLKGTYECAIGNFGVPKYGGTLVGSVLYPKVNQKGCTNFSDVNFQSKPGGLPIFPFILCFVHITFAMLLCLVCQSIYFIHS